MDQTQADLNTTEACVRKERLRTLLAQGFDIEDRMYGQDSAQTLKAISNVILTSNHIIDEGTVTDRAEHTTEVLMDAQLLRMNYELVSKVIAGSSNFNDHEFINHVNNIIHSDNESNWDAIAALTCRTSRTFHFNGTMLGLLDEEFIPRTQKQRSQRKKDFETEERRPEILDEIVRNEQGADKVKMVHTQVANIIKTNGGSSFPFYKLVIDPRDFMKSVENAFTMAHLASFNTIAIEKGADNFPCVRLCNKVERDAPKKAIQAICTFTPALWRQMINFYQIKDPLLKDLNNDASK